jgi:predicted O-linked N-acetylglucosamine transferase (SPINDLY family)
MGVVLTELGRHREALIHHDCALSLNPELAFAHSNRLYTKLHDSRLSTRDHYEDARAFGRKFADPLLRLRPFPNNKDSERRLRVGFVSGDFKQHAVNYFFEPFLSNLDKGQVECFAYSNTAAEDHVTDRLRGLFCQWVSIYGLSDDQATDVIEQDGIDILVDLAGHTAGNRLLVFARKPAPIQVSWLGYPGTTGMAAMDYRFTDQHSEPLGPLDDFSAEQLWRLPHVIATYEPSSSCPTPVDSPPCESNGYVTFGCLNRFTKVGDEALACWAQILSRVPNSKLLMEIADIDKPTVRSRVQERLERAGLPLSQVVFEPRTPGSHYLNCNRIDIALDPFPYNGGTTSMDTLWMGVPYIALKGDTLVSRMGSTVLSVLGLSSLVADTAQEYVGLAVGLASDGERLRAVRHDLRGRMAASPLMDHKLLCRSVEIAFRSMWQRWVESQQTGSRLDPGLA